MDEIGVASLVLFRFVVAMLRGGSADLLHHVCGEVYFTCLGAFCEALRVEHEQCMPLRGACAVLDSPVLTHRGSPAFGLSGVGGITSRVPFGDRVVLDTGGRWWRVRRLCVMLVG